MIEIITEPLIQTGVLGVVCAFFMYKDIYKDRHILKNLTHITKTLNKLAIVLDERIPRS